VTLEPVTVVYIGGSGRSGSTLLASILGALPGCYPVGEFQAIWNALERNELCGCGTTIQSCDFWQRVGDQAFGGWEGVDIHEMRALRHYFSRHRRLPLLLSPRVLGRSERELTSYLHALELLYHAVRTVSGCDVIVDSTKNVSGALLLHRSPTLRVRVVHLVRDSRAVAFSNKRTVHQPQYATHPTLRDEPMARYGPVESALRWSVQNLAFQTLRVRDLPKSVVRYEDLTRKPQELSDEIAKSLDICNPATLMAVMSRGHYEAKALHTVGGSRIRFKRGAIAIREDDEWKTAMRWFDRAIVTLLTIPLLRAYRYL
jgi:Sulfotransferase family